MVEKKELSGSFISFDFFFQKHSTQTNVFFPPFLKDSLT